MITKQPRLTKGVWAAAGRYPQLLLFCEVCVNVHTASERTLTKHELPSPVAVPHPDGSRRDETHAWVLSPGDGQDPVVLWAFEYSRWSDLIAAGPR
jgi:hypothetical protein